MKKNSNSSDAESVTEPTTKPESGALNMSAGAEMLIERMKTNPEDFKYGGKFYRVSEAVRVGAPLHSWISTRDIAALRIAHEELIQEPEFSEWVYGEIFNPKEPAPDVRNLYTQALGKSIIKQGSFSDPNGIYGSPLQGAALTVNANAGNPTMTLGNTTIDESTLKKIKNKLGL